MTSVGGRVSTALLFALCLALAPQKLVAQTSWTADKTGLYLVLIEVEANERHMAELAPGLKKTAIKDGKLTYLVAKRKGQAAVEAIAPEHILGLLRDPTKGLTKGNIVKSLPFYQNVWSIAAAYMTEDLEKAVMDNEYKTVILIDGRAKDPAASYGKIKADVIGFYELKNGKIEFTPNEAYELVTENGPVQLTPFIVERLFSK